MQMVQVFKDLFLRRCPRLYRLYVFRLRGSLRHKIFSDGFRFDIDLLIHRKLDEQTLQSSLLRMHSTYGRIYQEVNDPLSLGLLLDKIVILPDSFSCLSRIL